MTSPIKNLYYFANSIHKRFKSKKNYYSFGGVDIIVEYIFKNKN